MNEEPVHQFLVEAVEGKYRVLEVITFRGEIHIFPVTVPLSQTNARWLAGILNEDAWPGSALTSEEVAG